jgi:16S rRNA (cytosine967-C5)-methyltransferase
VLVDAPCSGTGVLRRDPDIKWSRAESDLAAFAATQVAMLREAARVVRPGGVLVYATCSSEPDENDDVVREFLTGAAAFEAVGDPLRTLPFAHGLDAFFAARLVRRESA